MGGKVQKAEKANVPSTNVVDFSADAGAGFEQMGEQDLKIPFMKIAEKMSEETEESNPNYIEGLKPGMIFNSVTQNISEQIEVIPCAYSRKEIEWRPKSAGGGLVGIHDPSQGLLAQTERNHEGRDILPNGNELIVTGQYAVMVNEGDDNWYPAIITMSKSRLTAGRRWNSQMANLKVETENGKVTPPMFGTKWLLKTTKKSNDKGTWSIWDFTPNGFVDDADLYTAAKQFREQVNKGEANVNYEADSPHQNNEDDESF